MNRNKKKSRTNLGDGEKNEGKANSLAWSQKEGGGRLDGQEAPEGTRTSLKAAAGRRWEEVPALG